MTESFQNTNNGGTPADNAETTQGETFQKGAGDSQAQTAGGVNITQEDLTTLQKRDTHAQTHIKTMEEEAAELRQTIATQQEALNKAATYQEVLEGMKNDQETGNSTSTMSPEEMIKLAAQAVKLDLDGAAKATLENDNWNSVTQELTVQYGEKSDAHVGTVCEQLGISWDQAVSMAKTTPKLFKSTFGIKESTGTAQGSESTLNASAFKEVASDGIKTNIMAARDSRERAGIFDRALAAKLAELGQ